MLNFSAGVLHWWVRVNGYAFLLTDRYPPFALGPDDSYPVRLSLSAQSEGRNRLTTFWLIRYILAIPHLIIVGILGYVAEIVVFIAWFIVLFKGSMPEGLHNFLAGYQRWSTRQAAYVLNLVDAYPPFSLS